MTTMLAVRDLHAGYDESSVLQGLNFELKKGEVVCLLGANGAGKTTTMAVLSGLVDASSGSVTYDGQDLLAMPSHRRVEAGLSLSPEGRQGLPEPHRRGESGSRIVQFQGARRSRARLEEVYTLFPRLAERRVQSAGLMSGGEQQMLALGRAIMAKPRLLLLDEPSLGLAPMIVQAVFEAIRKIAATDITIFLVEQNTHAALSIASRGYVMSAGRIVHAGSAAELRQSPEVRDAFIGGKSARTIREARHA